MIRFSKSAGGCLVLSLLLASCHEGQGSDIGPTLQPLPANDYRVTVRDDAGNPVAAAKVTFSGSSREAVTGRTGRIFLQGSIGGQRVVQIDGSSAAATDTSQLGTLSILANLPDGDELPFVVYLPDAAGNAISTIATGVQSTTTVIDNSNADPNLDAGILTVTAGEAVTSTTGAASVSLTTARLAVGHLPPTIPDVSGVAMVTSPGVHVFPEDARFASGAQLSIVNAGLNLAAGATARIFRLDDASGQWSEVGVATESGGRVIAGGVDRGGLYCVAVAVPAVTTLTGRVVDRQSRGVSGALVHAPQSFTRSAGDGTFSLSVARTDATGADRAVVVEVTGGRFHLPTRVTTGPTVLAADALDLGTIELDTRPATNVRLLMLHQGRVQAHRRVRMSTAEGLVAESTNGGATATAIFEDLPAENSGVLTTQAIDSFRLRRTWGRFFLFPFAVDNAISLFSTEDGWRASNSRGSLLQVVDRFGTGPIFEVEGMVGTDPAGGFIGRTDLNGFIGAAVGLTGEVTLAHETTSDDRRVISAFTVLGTASGRQEVPIERAHRLGLGKFQRFGMYTGRLTSTASGNTHRVRATGQMTLADFYDEVFLGHDSQLGVPVQLTPANPLPATGTHYRVGVPKGPGHLIAVEGTTTGSVFQAERFGGAVGLDITEGVVTDRDLALDLAADTNFRLTNGFVGLAAGSLTFDAAAELPNGLLVDLLRGGVATQDSVVTDDILMRLPALDAWGAGFTNYVVGVGVTSSSATGATMQRTFARLGDGRVVDRRPLAVPGLSVSASPSANGFQAFLAPPADCNYVVLQLRHVEQTPAEVRDWTVLLPPDRTEFTFHRLQSELPQVLATKSDPGNPWTLTMTCVRIDEGPLTDPALTREEIFWRVQAHWVGLTAAGQGATAFSSRSIVINTN